jgi:hypothetical protein
LIKKFRKIHGEKYNYLNSKYIGARNKIEIICKEHGVFEQLVFNHLAGKGCPKCAESHGEQKIRVFLEKANIKYEKEKRFLNCKYKYPLAFDFFIPSENLCIEYQGQQHYEPFKKWGGKEIFELQKIRDQIKIDYCEKQNIELLCIKYDEKVEQILKTRFKII